MRRIFISLTSFLVLFGVQLSAQTAVSWGDQQINGVRESASTALFTPGRYAFDGYSTSYWALSSGSTSGWLERYWDSAQRIIGATLQIKLPANVKLQFSYESNGAWVPISGAYISTPVNDTATVWFPGQMPETKKMLVTVEGAAADQVRIYDIKWQSNSFKKPFGKITPKSYTFNQPEYINLKPSRLWEGILSNTWYEPLWSFPWEIFQTDRANSPESIFPPYKGNPHTPAEIIWELDGTYQIEALKAYFLNPWRCISFEFWNGTAWANAETFEGNSDEGWNRIDLASAVTTNKIRITFPRGWEQARFIQQIEVWGEGFEESPVRPLVIPPVAADGKYHFTITGLEELDYQLEVAVKGSQATAIQGQFNGVGFTSQPVMMRGEDTIYRFAFDKEQFRSDVQFLQLKPASELHGVVLCKQIDKGQIYLGDHYSDGYFTEPVNSALVPKKEITWDLKKGYELEKIRIYGAYVPDLTLKIEKLDTPNWWHDFKHPRDPEQETISLRYDLAGFWEADLNGVQTGKVTLSSAQPFLLNEVQLYGSPLSDDHGKIEIWWPKKGHDITSDSSNGDSIIGWMGDASMQPRLGDFHPRQQDKLFWMPLSQMDFGPDQEQDFNILGKLGDTQSSQNWKVRWKTNKTIATLDQGTALISTSDPTILLSGTVAKKNTRCFVNDTEVTITSSKFTTTIPLAEGYQVIDIKIWDKQKRKILTSFQKPVYRTVGQPIVVFDQPYGDIWSQNPTLYVTGRVGNGMGLSLSIDDSPVALVADSFSKTISLKEGTQVIKFVLKDVSGRKTEKLLTINRDSTIPVISIITPTEGQYIAHSDVEFNINGGSDPKLWWQFNQEDWEPGEQTIKTKTYIFPDDFYSYTIHAQDRSGNISAPKTVNFCVDITQPVPFAINANVSGWTNNNTPTITFSTTDATSGVDHYEYNVDGSAWVRIASPFKLPVLADGIRDLFVRAIDKAGNIRNSTLKLYIDTSNPPIPVHFRPVPGTDNIGLKWTGIDDGEQFQTYRIERNPAWADGVHSLSVKAYGDQEYHDPDVIFKQLLSYRIWAVDRAGNESPKTDWYSAQVGLESSPVSRTEETVVEYENITLRTQPEAIPEDIIKIQVNEVPLDSINQAPINPLISNIFQVTAVRQSGSSETITNHADLLQPVAVEFTYSPSKLPEYYTESDLKPYYYDDLWGRWVPIDDAYVDTRTHTMRFKTNHFTDFSIQATKAVDLSPQQLRDVEFSPFGTNVGSGGVNVSSNGGSVSTSFTELVLPGKNGLDLVLKRNYDTGTAQSDAAAANTPDPTTPVVDFDGDKPWMIADGWRLNFPSMKWNGSGLWMTDLDGNRLSFNQLSSSVTSQNGNLITVTMINHEGSDLQAVVTFRKTDHYKYFIFPAWNWVASTTYSVESAQLFMKDGRELNFDSHGRIRSIWDATHKNKIEFSYDPALNRIASIRDSMDRVISFAYTTVTPVAKSANSFGDVLISSITDPSAPTNPKPVDLITKISVSGGGESYPDINYTLDNTKLKSTVDVGGRTWNYGYTPIGLASSSQLQNPPSGYVDSPGKTTTVNALSEVSGPGIGKTKIEYTTQVLSYNDTVDGSGNTVSSAPGTASNYSGTQTYTYTISSTRLLAKKQSVFLADETTPQRETNYAFTMAYGDHKQHYTASSVIDDGRIKSTTTFEKVTKTRSSLSQAPEALRKTIGYSVGPREDNTEISNYTSKVERTTATELVDTETQVWITDIMKMKSRTLTKAPTNTSTTEYTYDAWGNVTQQIDTSLVGTRKSKKQVDRIFFIPPQVVGIIPIPGTDLAKVPQGYTLPTAVTYPLITNNQTNLLASSKTQIFGWRSDDTADTSSETATEFEYYSYNALGQMETKNKYADGGSWAATSYTYDPVTGQIATVTAPATNTATGQVTSYAYDYSRTSEYRITTTQKSVVRESGGTPEDLIKTSGYRKLTGTLSWSKDSSDFVTQYTYDNLGRTKKIIKPVVGEASTIPDTAADRSRNPTTSIDYDDTGLSSTVTNELKGTTKYQFDALGRLTSVVKTNTDPSASETITTTLVYDGYDQVKEMHGPVSNHEVDTTRTLDSLVTTFAYDAQGRVTSTKAPGASNAKTSTYDNANNTVTVTDELYHKTRQTTDWNGKVIVSEAFNDGKWISSKTYYDGAGRPIAQIDPKLNKTEISYNSLGLESTITAPPRTVWENNTATENVKPKTTKTYYLNGSLKSVSQEVSGGYRTTTNSEVNGLGWVLKTEIPDSLETTAKIVTVKSYYDKNGNKLSEKSGYSTDTLKGKSWTYDAQGRVRTEKDELNHVTSYEYDQAGNRTKVTDPRNANLLYTSEFTLSLAYDQFNRLITATLPKADRNASGNGPQVKMAYDGRGNLVSRTEADNVTTKYSYNLRNWLVTESVTGGTTTYTTSHEYDAAGHETKVTTPTGKIVEFAYDELGRVKYQGSASAGWTIYTYDDNGNKETVTDPLGHTTAYEYNPDNKVTSSVDAKTKKSTISYDRLGQSVRTVNANSDERKYAYDLLGRLLTETTPTASILSYTYDGWGNVQTFIDARGTSFVREYYENNKLKRETASNGGTSEAVSYTYDEAGDIKTADNGVATAYNVVNGSYQPNPYGLMSKYSNTVNGNILEMSYAYDNRQRLTGVTLPDASSVTYGYNLIGELSTMSNWVTDKLVYEKARLKSFQLANGVVKNYTYDDQDRVATIGYAHGSESLLDYAYTYDKASNLIKKNNNSYDYDELNQLKQSTEYGWFQKLPQDISMDIREFERDYDGQSYEGELVPSIITLDTASKSITCDVKSNKFVNKIELCPDQTDPDSKDHRINAEDIAIYSRLDNTSTTNTPWVNVENWTLERNTQTGVLTIYFSERFAARYIKISTIWDDRIENNDSVATFTTFKNASNKMVKIWTLNQQNVVGYEYDAVGNRTSINDDGNTSTYEYYPHTSWIKKNNGWHYGYDANGNRIWRAKEVTGTNQIDTSKEYWTYDWDLHNRLKTVTSFNTEYGAASNVTVNYTYDAQNYRVKRIGKDGTTIYAYGRQGALAYSKNLTTGLERTYAYLNNQIIGWTEKAGTAAAVKYFALSDHLGSITKITDEQANVVWESEYLPFGNVAGTNGPKRFEGLYVGKDIDPDTGLTYHWNRWRSEDGSTFISEDPARDGSNWYGYANNSPLVYTDPTGLLSEHERALIDGEIDYSEYLKRVGHDSEEKRKQEALAQSMHDGKLDIAALATHDPAAFKELYANFNGSLDSQDVNDLVPLMAAQLDAMRSEMGSIGANGFGSGGLITAADLSLMAMVAPERGKSRDDPWKIAGGFLLAAATVFGGPATEKALNAVIQNAPKAVQAIMHRIGGRAVNAELKEGEFLITDFSGYPAGVPRPTGPVRILDGAEYEAARDLANSANRTLHKLFSSLKGFDIHEIVPVKFGGSPTSLANKIPLDPQIHRQVTAWWNQLLKTMR